MGESEKTPVEELLPILADQPLVGTGEATRSGEPANGLIAPAVTVGDQLPDDLALAEQTQKSSSVWIPPGIR